MARFCNTVCLCQDTMSRPRHVVYFASVPKLWNDTIEEHRQAVREAMLATTAALVAKLGLRGVTMSRIAKETGIGRATLYKYFPDVEAILLAWHERLVGGHLAALARLRDQPGDAAARLAAVLESYALMHQQQHDTEIAALLHRGAHVGRAEAHLVELVRALVAEGSKAGLFRDDVPPGELAGYCLGALTAASGLTSKAAVRRLVTVTLAGLRAP